jgi:hypothetical protein
MCDDDDDFRPSGKSLKPRPSATDSSDKGRQIMTVEAKWKGSDFVEKIKELVRIDSIQKPWYEYRMKYARKRHSFDIKHERTYLSFCIFYNLPAL